MQLLPAGPVRQDETGIFQNLEVLHHTKARHGQPGLQVLQRAAVALKEQIQEDATRSVSKCLEYLVVVRHLGTIGDHMVTCQVGACRNFASCPSRRLAAPLLGASTFFATIGNPRASPRQASRAPVRSAPARSQWVQHAPMTGHLFRAGSPAQSLWAR